MLVFGAGTDYALLLVARYREELRRHEDRHEAMAVALHRAGPAIIASAATVIVSMLRLMSPRLNSTRGLGPVAAIGVVVALLAMMTLLPALLVIFGRWVFWPVRPAVRLGRADHAAGFWARVGTPHRRQAAAGLGRHRRGARRDGARPVRPEGQRPDQRASRSPAHPDSVVGAGGHRPALPGRRADSRSIVIGDAAGRSAAAPRRSRARRASPAVTAPVVRRPGTPTCRAR